MIMRLSAVMSIVFSLTGACWAGTPVAQGKIQFQGSIVEPNCASRTGERATFELNVCPSPLRATTIIVNNVATVNDSSSIKVRLVSDTGRNGRYYNQRYELVDKSGMPIRSGNYLVTLSLP